MPVVLNRKLAGVPPGAVYVWRPTKWGNPFRYSKAELSRMNVDATIDHELERYEAHVRSKPYLMSALGELSGKDLVCWCSPARCHAEVLLRLVEEFEKGIRP